MQRPHLRFDGVAGDQPVHHDVAGLPDAVGTVDGLRLRRGIPPWVEQETVVRFHQIQAESAGLEADEKHRCRSGLEFLEYFSAFAGLAVQIQVVDSGGVEPCPDAVEEPGELAEHQCSVPADDHVVELFEQRIDLRGADCAVRVVDERRIEAHLPQQGQRPQDREAVAVEVVDEPENLLSLPLQLPVVERTVFRCELDLEYLLLFRRQVGGDLFLRATQHQRFDALP